MIRKRFELDMENPPGQIVNPIPYEIPPLDKSIEEWKRWEAERNGLLLQDCNRRLSQTLSNTPGARRIVKENADKLKGDDAT